MVKKYGPYLLLLAFSALFFWQFILLGRIPIDPSPLYQMRPWSTLPQARNIVHPLDPAKYYHNIDPIIEVFPVKKWLSTWLRIGDVPLWNPELFSGTPFAANHHAAPWDLSTILFLIFPTDLAFGLTLLLQLFAAGSSMFFYCRTLQISMRASLFGSLSFMLNSFFLHWLGLISFNAGLIWMPLIPAGMELAFRKGNWRYVLISSAGLGFSFLSGMAQFWLFNVLLFFAYGIYLAWVYHKKSGTAILKSVRILLLALLLAAGLGAVQIVQTLGSIGYSSRGGDAQESLYSGRNHLSPRKLLTLVIPDVFSRVEENIFSKLLLRPPTSEGKGFWGKLLWGEKGFVLNRSWGYIGIAGFFFMWIGFRYRDTPLLFHKCLIAAILSFQVLLCLKPVHHFFLRLWAGFDTLDHIRTIALYALSASVLAAVGLDHLSEIRSRLPIYYRCLLAGVIVLFCVILFLHTAPRFLPVEKQIELFAQNNTNPEFGQQFFLDATKKIEVGFSQSASILYAPVLFLIAIALALLLFHQSRWSKSKFQAAIIVIALVDLLYHGWTDPPLVYTEHADLYPRKSKAVEFLQKDPDDFRVYELQRKKPGPQLPMKNYSMLDSIRRGSIRFFDLRTVDFVFRPNTLLAYDIPSAGGYLSLYPQRYKRLWEGRGMDILKAVKEDQPVERWNAPWIGMQNIKYLAVPEEVPTGNWQPAYHGEGLKLLKVDSFCPPIYVVPKAWIMKTQEDLLQTLKSPDFNPLKEVLLEQPVPEQMISSLNVPYTVVIRKRIPDLLQMDVDVQQNGFLVLTENLTPGWRAIVNGMEQPLLRANYAFMCLPLKKGFYKIQLEFRPAFYGVSLIITVVSAIIIVLLGIMKLLNRKRRDVNNP
jgi:Bacterial membrane protein YfhO